MDSDDPILFMSYVFLIIPNLHIANYFQSDVNEFLFKIKV